MKTSLCYSDFTLNYFIGRSLNTSSLLAKGNIYNRVGDSFHFTSDTDGDVLVNGVRIINPNIPTTNGIIHVVDRIIPKYVEPTTSPVTPNIGTTLLNTVAKMTSTTKSTNEPSAKITTRSTSPQKTSLSQASNSITTLKTTPALTKRTSVKPHRKPINVHPNLASTSTTSGVQIGVVVAVLVLIISAVCITYLRGRRRMFSFTPLVSYYKYNL